MTDDVAELRAFGREHGIAALLDHLGLDEFGNEVISLRRQLAGAVEERDRYREALQEIASDLGKVGDPAWREAMEALGLDADAAERAWHS
jgi:hypothetical protein